jgi:hypothetical protein
MTFDWLQVLHLDVQEQNGIKNIENKKVILSAPFQLFS